MNNNKLQKDEKINLRIKAELTDISDSLASKVIHRAFELNKFDLDGAKDLTERPAYLLASKIIILYTTKEKINIEMLSKRLINNKTYIEIAEELHISSTLPPSILRKLDVKLRDKTYFEFILGGAFDDMELSNNTLYETCVFAGLKVSSKASKENILSTDIECLNLSNRIENALYRSKLNTYKDLVKIINKERLNWYTDNKVRGIGKEQALQIENELIGRGLIESLDVFKSRNDTDVKKQKLERAKETKLKAIKKDFGKPGLDLWNLGFDRTLIRIIIDNNLYDIQKLVRTIRNNRVCWYRSEDITKIGEKRAKEIEEILIRNNLLQQHMS